MYIIMPSKNTPGVEARRKALKKMFPKSNVIIAHDPEGNGKGWAIKQVLSKLKYDRPIVLIDADDNIPIWTIKVLLPYLDYYDVVVARKRIQHLPFKRKWVSMGHRILIKILFRLPVWDTQTGLKIYKHAIPFWIDGFAFDVEMLMNARRLGMTMKDVPIDVHVNEGVKLGAILKTLKDVIILRFQL